MVCVGSPWLRLGWKPAQMTANTSRHPMDHLWTTLGQVFGDFGDPLTKSLVPLFCDYF